MKRRIVAAMSSVSSMLVYFIASWTPAQACSSNVDAGASGPTAQASLEYTLKIQSPASQEVRVSVRLTGLEPKQEPVSWNMQQRFAFIRLPEPLLEGPVRATAGTQPIDCEHRSPFNWSVPSAGARTMRLDYVVPLTHRTIEAVKERDAYEYPYVTDDHGFLVSPTLFLFPENVTVGEMRVRFILPDGWQIVAPWRRLGEHEFDPGEPDSLLNDLIAIGAWHIHPLRIGHFEGTIAFAPGQEALERTAVDMIRRIVEYELELFGGQVENRYAFLFARPDGKGLAGSPKKHSVTLCVEPRLVPAAGTHLGHLIAHEFYHTWASALFAMPDELRWLNEGITDYYAYLVPARLGLNTWEQFARTLGDKMQQCAANPLRGKRSLADAGGEEFFNETNAYNLVYDGGLLTGAWLDMAIRRGEGGKTLDDLMRALVNDPRWLTDGTAPTLEDFLATAGRFADPATCATLRRLVTQPYDLDPVKAFGGVGITIRREVGPPEMDLMANLDGTHVIDLSRSGLAFRLGVRPGDRFVEVNGQAVSTPDEVHKAWRRPAERRIQATLDRLGKTIEIDEPVPLIERFTVPSEPWRLAADR
ncbi:MAG TPA: hypothetical protein VM243_10925 [Phycisphaerae bacterium]|nr:hypothetical protein [Phycisphaerae bacterium]